MVAPESRRLVIVIARRDTEGVAEFVALVGSHASIDVEVIFTDTVGDVDDAVSTAADRGASTIASAGGDGALNLVASAVVRSGSDITVVPVPFGTVNLASQVFGLATVDEVVDAIVADSTRVIDVGETDQGLFVLNASTGFDAAVIDDAEDHSDARFGKLAFLRAGVRRLRRQSGTHVQVASDDVTVFEGQAMSVLMMNVGQRVSDSLHIAPDAEPDDGLLDIVVVRADSIPRMMTTVWRLVRGREVPERDAVRAQAARTVIGWSSERSVQRDGDPDASRRLLTVSCRAAALRIHCESSQSPAASIRRATTN